LFGAVDKHGRLIDFRLADRRNTRAAHRFLGKALTTMRHWPPSSITTDQLGAYPKAILRLQSEGRLSAVIKHRTCKYLNNIIEADQGALKQVIRPTQGFQTMKTAAATIKGFQVMRLIRRAHCLTGKPSVKDEVRFVNKLFNIFSRHLIKEQQAKLRPNKLMHQSRHEGGVAVLMTATPSFALFGLGDIVFDPSS
jgi:IS6 family transposase